MPGRLKTPALLLAAGLAGAAPAVLLNRAAAPPPAAAPWVVPAGLVADVNRDTGAGTDNGPLIQAAIDSGATDVRLPPGVYGVATTLRFNPVTGRSFGGATTGTLGPTDITSGTWLVWTGPPGGTLIDLRGVRCRFHDLGVCAAGNTSLDAGFDLETPSSYPGISSQHTFERVCVAGGYNGPVSKGFVVGADQAANNEFHRWRQCCFSRCAYAGIQVPNGTMQAKNHVVEQCTFGGSLAFRSDPNAPTEYGFVAATGSARFRDCNFDALGMPVKWFGAAGEPVIFSGCTGENCLRYYDGVPVNWTVFTGCRFSCNMVPVPQVSGQEAIHAGQNLVIDACSFEDSLAVNGVPLTGFLRPGSGGVMSVRNVQFSSPDPFQHGDGNTWRANLCNVRVATDNLLPDGPYDYVYTPNYAQGAGGLVLSDGHYPLPVTFAGGTPAWGAGVGLLYTDGSGQLFWRVGAAPPRPVQLGPAP